MRVRPAGDADFDAVLALNEESVAFLSPLSRAGLVALHREAALHQVIEQDGLVTALLIALREGARYDSPNYRWFAARYERFLYVDRVVVSGRARGTGAGTMLYRGLFDFAAASSVGLVTCEFDVEPPNPASERFHAKFGFREVGRQYVANGKKLVSLQAAPVRRG
jgi:hypothetical protein